MPHTTLKLGTRRSLLAWAQSSWVAREIERLNPGVKVELDGIDTRGDKIVDVSLRNVVGKEFFVGELDDALREHRVDFTVHSMKDLSLDRPAGFVLAAIPKRENPRDVILFGPSAVGKLKAGETLKIGTSSPRRLENIPPFLEKALPRFGSRGQPNVDLVEIRGNVNTRLSRVHEPQGSERALDGVVLAFAGLNRLWIDEKGRAELAKLLIGVRWMVLPLRENPAAPAQGALAIECRDPSSGDERDVMVHAAIHKMHDVLTATRVASERQLLADWGGGCHQRFGATATAAEGLNHLLYVRGRKPDGEFVEELRWKKPESVAAKGDEIWDGKAVRAGEGGGKSSEHSSRDELPPSALRGGRAESGPKSSKDSSRDESVQVPSNVSRDTFPATAQDELIPGALKKSLADRAVFVAHSRAVPAGSNHAAAEVAAAGLLAAASPGAPGARVWTSGTPSWFRLAAQGIWVEGCAEGFGFDALRETIDRGALQLPVFGPQWTVLTHADARENWHGADVVATYRVLAKISPEQEAAEKQAVARAKHLFWSSGSQFDRYGSSARTDARHYCGPGKTAEHLKSKGIEPVVFPNSEEWKKWITR